MRYDELYAFSYNPKQKESEQVKGWQLIDLAEEYKRMGVPNTNWQLSDANRDYKVKDNGQFGNRGKLCTFISVTS